MQAPGPRHSATAAARSAGGPIRNPFRDADRARPHPVTPGPARSLSTARNGSRVRAPASPGMTPGRNRD